MLPLTESLWMNELSETGGEDIPGQESMYVKAEGRSVSTVGVQSLAVRSMR